MAGCGCPHANTCSPASGLMQMGIDVHKYDYVIALAGNPNTGKTTLFNALTGLRQHTGNWPGKTVVRAEGVFRYQDKKFKVVDLPGTYSLLSTSDDEEIARNFLLFGRPDCTVVVVDATSLERNLNLVLQILEITDEVVVALNLMDEAERRGIYVDDRKLAKELGVPVIPTVARDRKGLDRLLQTVMDLVSGKIKTQPRRVKLPESMELAISQLLPHLKQLYPHLPNHRWLAMRLLEADPGIEQALLHDGFSHPDDDSGMGGSSLPVLEPVFEV